MTAKEGFSSKLVTAILFAVVLLLFGCVDLSISNAYPLVPFSLIVAYSCFAQGPSLVVALGLLSGVVMDSFASKAYCFNTLALGLISCGCYLLSAFVFNKNLKATLALCFLLASVYFIFYWLIFICFSVSFEDSVTYLLQYALPSSVYTSLFSAPFYFIFKKLDSLKAR